jgi:putative ATPase
MSPSLFDEPGDPSRPADGAAGAPGEGTPLAERMRPRTLDDLVGQAKLVGPQGLLRRALAAARVPSLVFWGPPGTGKTSLARLIAATSRLQFVPFSAVTSGIAEIKQVMAGAEKLRRATGRRTLLFVDEIHRFNRAQQDAFLPYVERGDIVLVGATTENPSFELNAALLSRCRVVVLEPLSPEELAVVAARALADGERGLGRAGVTAEPRALAEIAQLAGGDARRALNLLEAAVAEALERGATELGAELVVEVAQRKVLLYDKSGEEHFNLISALHKSLRESDPDAALYWLGRMLEAGEDPNYLARRMVRFAVEDVGLAAPEALGHALAAWEAYERLGSPEGDLALAQAAIELALAPKSVSVYRAWGAVRETIRDRPADPVPLAIRNAPTRLMKEIGYGREYVYAPDTEEGVAGLECLPDALRGARFYRPTERGAESQLAARLEEFAARRRRAREGAGPAPEPRGAGVKSGA